MHETKNDSLAKPGADRAEGPADLTCPRCKARYQPARPTRGRRVRCRHCRHVWRDEPGASARVAGALDAAAANWMRLGSTLLAKTDHASTLAHAVSEAARPSRPVASEWIDRSLGRYDIKTVLGQGAMGYVYEAWDRDLKRSVALKILPKRIEPGCEPIGLKMFLQEARLAANLQHPNVVTVYEIGAEDGIHYFAMERIHGVTVARLVEEHGPLPTSQCLYIVAAAARALATGHAAGAVHRDVKPSNIMINTSGLVKVTDFGLADVGGIEGVSELSARPVGTPGWMSPETARGERTGPAGDIYSLGLVLYFVLTGERLVDADTRSGVVRKHQAAVSVRHDAMPADWPPRLRDIVVQCLQADPRDRYQSADTLAAELLRALVPSEDDATVVLSDGGHAVRGRVPLLVSRLALVLLAVVTGLFGLWWWVIRTR